MDESQPKPGIVLSYEQHRALANLVIGTDSIRKRGAPDDPEIRMTGNIENGTLAEVTVETLARIGGVGPDDRAVVTSYGRELFQEFDNLEDEQYIALGGLYKGTRLSRLYTLWREYTGRVTGEAITPVSRVERSFRFASFMVSKSVEYIEARPDADIEELQPNGAAASDLQPTAY